MVWNWSIWKVTIQVTGHFTKPTIVWFQMNSVCGCVFLADGGLQSSIQLLFWQQRVPLGHRAPGVGQHVRPVAQPNTWGTVSDPALADGVVAAQLVVVVHSDQYLDFLRGDNRGRETVVRPTRMYVSVRSK